MKRICVYCGSNTGSRREYLESAIELGKLLAKRKIELVYGGAQVGLMGAIASTAMENGGKVYDVVRLEHLQHQKELLVLIDETHEEVKEVICALSLDDTVLYVSGDMYLKAEYKLSRELRL